jgi:hypothetical protein
MAQVAQQIQFMLAQVAQVELETVLLMLEAFMVAVAVVQAVLELKLLATVHRE